MVATYYNSGCHLQYLWLPPTISMVATSHIYGCHLPYLWLPPTISVVACYALWLPVFSAIIYRLKIEDAPRSKDGLKDIHFKMRRSPETSFSIGYEVSIQFSNSCAGVAESRLTHLHNLFDQSL